MSEKRLTACLKARVVKPASGTWDELGALLRALSAPLHRVCNNVMAKLELGAALAKQGVPNEQLAAAVEDVDLSPPVKAQGRGQTSLNPRTLCYRLTVAEWKAERERAAARVASGRAYAGDEAIASITPHSCAVLGAQGMVFTAWSKWDKERWRGAMTLPTFRGGAPICVASSGGGVVLESVDGQAVLTVKLALGVKTSVILGVDGGSAHATMRKLLESPESVGDCKIVQNRSKRTWEVRLAYSFMAAEHCGSRTMAIHRGMSNLLTVAIARGAEESRDAKTFILESGEDILRHKNAYHARRRSLGQQKRQLGGGAKGHGRARRHEHITRLEDAETRYVRSKCQEVAANAIGKAVANGVGKIIVEDWATVGDDAAWFVRRWPWGALRECIQWAAAKAGIAVETAPTAGNGTTCPVCGGQGTTGGRDGRMFMCGSCRLERQRDVIFAWNMLANRGHAAPLEEAIAQEKKVAKKLKRTRSNVAA